MKEKKSVGYIIGQILGIALVACLAICVGGVAVSLTTKFLLWLF